MADTTTALRLLDKYPNHIPVVATTTRLLNAAISRNRFLVPRDSTVGEFQARIRQYLPGVGPEVGVFLIFGDKSICAGATRMAQVYVQNRGADLFLHVAVTGENTFGRTTGHLRLKTTAGR
jgi:hypothetical protein